MFMLAPGDCSPSRSVVSKIRTRFESGDSLVVVESAGVVVLMDRPFPSVLGCSGLRSTPDPLMD
jgi:hypothetical protein